MFTSVIEEILKTLNCKDIKINIHGRTSNYLIFVDDIVKLVGTISIGITNNGKGVWQWENSKIIKDKVMQN